MSDWVRSRASPELVKGEASEKIGAASTVSARVQSVQSGGGMWHREDHHRRCDNYPCLEMLASVRWSMDCIHLATARILAALKQTSRGCVAAMVFA